MDINIIKDLIANFGVPICSAGILFYLYYRDKEQDRADAKERETKCEVTLTTVNNTNREIVETNRLLVEKFTDKLNSIENDVKEIKEVIKK